MNHLLSSSKMTTSRTNAMMLMPRKNPWRGFKNDSAQTTLGPCILVVEDDPSVALMLRDVLDAWGYNVVLAQNGREGLDVLAKQMIDGILLDIHMPVMDGPTMLDWIRWVGYKTPVIVMSGGLDGPPLRQFVKEGAQGFLGKPISLPSLQNVCATVFENPGIGVPSGDHVHVA
jgi:CheY-like chemotaxis protein